MVFIRDGSVPKMCTSGGRQCKTVPIPGLRVLVHPNQTWLFPLNDITIKVAKNMRKTCIISSDFLFVPNILSFPSILCVVKEDLGYKVS